MLGRATLSAVKSLAIRKTASASATRATIVPRPSGSFASAPAVAVPVIAGGHAT